MERVEVDNRVVVPEKTHLRNIVRSVDVRHTWSMAPSLGVKCDPVPDHFLGKVINCQNSKLSLTGGKRERAYHIHPPLCERPRT